MTDNIAMRDVTRVPGAGEKCHLIGVAGTGMSAVARILLAMGCRVTGSDRDRDAGRNSETVRKLAACGVGFFPQNGSGITDETSLVLMSAAVEPDNPDLKAAQLRGIECALRNKVLAAMSATRRTVAVAGTSGKSTVTGMIGWILEQLGADPVVVNGAAVLDWVSPQEIGNVRCGASDLWVVEADESDGLLSEYRPEWAVITNASPDHFDMDKTTLIFDEFAAGSRSGCVDMRNESDPATRCRIEVFRGRGRFRYRSVDFDVNLPGRHNAENALCAVMLCDRLGYDPASVAGPLRRFNGLRRRLERVGSVAGITVIDDYAHNPAKIRAAWSAAVADYGRVLGIWRPHGFRPLASMREALVRTFAGICRPSDSLYILPVYDAGGSADRSMNSDIMVDMLRGAGVNAVWIAGGADAERILTRDARAGDVIVTMGARDPDLPALARRILASISGRT